MNRLKKYEKRKEMLKILYAKERRLQWHKLGSCLVNARFALSELKDMEGHKESHKELFPEITEKLDRITDLLFSVCFNEKE